MSELFDDENNVLVDDENNVLVAEGELNDAEVIIVENRPRPMLDARRILENLMDEKRLRDELEDFLD